jgi:energy-coupling factor transporter ATP-binding protein EcfA2
MEIIKVDLQNCFGIQEMHHEFDFRRSNAIAIYARNGLMKTSFAKTFQSIQANNVDDICDSIFGDAGSATVIIDGRDIASDDVFVIKSFESSYESDITSLLVKDTVKERLRDVLKARDKLLKALEKSSGLKIKKTTGGKTTYELETAIIEDFGFAETSILLNLDALAGTERALYCGNVVYSAIFDSTVLKKIMLQDFQEQIQAFITSSDRVYESFGYLEKGQLTLPKLKDIRKSLEKDCFFVRSNQLVLAGIDTVGDMNALGGKINEIEVAIRQVPELQAIETLLSDAKGMFLKDVIETHPEIVEFLALDQLPMLRKALWLSYISDNQGLFDDLSEKYHVLSEEIDAVALDDTPWKQALDIFKKRFTVPYSMTISNLKGAIIGESIPRVEFSFIKGARTVSLDRAKLDELDTLSQGEKRALYLLNIIFDIEQIKASGQEKLLIVDDIADSFDYKNKYAIIEYLYELAQEDQFYLLVLSHNFDFYRTVSSRLNLKRDNKLTANTDGTTITIDQEYYQDKPFKWWKEHPSTKNVLALIPFVRNLVEFGEDRNISQMGQDFLFLTSLLHEKTTSHSITFGQILPLYQAYDGVTSFQPEVQLADSVLDSLYTVCDALTIADTPLENKIVLAMAIRHKAEEYMLNQINQFQGQISWRDNRRNYSGTSADFLTAVAGMSNQTRELLNGYKQFGAADSLEILNEVSIMTPENIHLNSFMYEPLLDMDVVELLDLYTRIRSL